MKELIQQVKNSEFDYEFYPTTSEIIKIIDKDIKNHFSCFQISIKENVEKRGYGKYVITAGSPGYSIHIYTEIF